MRGSTNVSRAAQWSTAIRWGIMWGVGDSSIEQQYVLYAAATSSTLIDLLQHWRPWEPELEWPDMAVHVPRLAQAIVELVEAGWVEVFLGAARRPACERHGGPS